MSRVPVIALIQFDYLQQNWLLFVSANLVNIFQDQTGLQIVAEFRLLEESKTEVMRQPTENAAFYFSPRVINEAVSFTSKSTEETFFTNGLLTTAFTRSECMKSSIAVLFSHK